MTKTKAKTAKRSTIKANPNTGRKKRPRPMTKKRTATPPLGVAVNLPAGDNVPKEFIIVTSDYVAAIGAINKVNGNYHVVANDPQGDRKTWRTEAAAQEALGQIVSLRGSIALDLFKVLGVPKVT